MNDGRGRPLFFDLDKYLDSVEGMINADEVERAIWMLDNLPGYYRDHIPRRAKEIRTQLHKNLFTPVQYHDEYGELDMEALRKAWPGRGKVIEDLVRGYNQQGLTPGVMEYAPGTFWLPIGLRASGLQFRYEFKCKDQVETDFEPPADDSPVNIFVALEVIEHLSNEWELYQNYLKFGRHADVVVISTPLYTINGGEDNWRARDLGHLRTYTPVEFRDKLSKMFEGYEWSGMVDESIILVGKSQAGWQCEKS